MSTEDRIPLADWLVAGLVAIGLHAFLLLALTSSDLARIGEPQAKASTASRLRIALGTPAAEPAPPPAVVARARPVAPPRPPSTREPAPAAAPRIETESQPLPHVAARAVPAAAGDLRGADLQNGGETEPAGEFRSDYFSDLHARVVAVLDYPPRAKNERVEGTVVVRVRIDRDGRIQSSQVAESSGSRVLDRHALRITKRAAPFGPVPAHFEADDLAFELPVEFALRD